MSINVTAKSLVLTGLFVILVCAQDQPLYITDWPIRFFMRSNPYSIVQPLMLQSSVIPEITSDLDYSPYYLENRSDGIHRRFVLWQQSNHLVFPVLIKKTRVRFDGWISGQHAELDYDFNGEYGVRLRNSMIQTGTSISVPVIHHHGFLHAGIGMVQSKDHRSMEYQIGVSLIPVSGFGAQYLFQKRSPVLHMQAEYEESNYELQIVGMQDNHSVRINWNRPEHLWLTAEARYTKIRSTNIRKQERSYFRPEGFHKVLKTTAEFNLSEQLRVGLNSEFLEGEFPGYLSENGQSFGKMTRLAIDQKNVDGSLSIRRGKSRYQGTLAYGNGNFESRGHVESWPFTDTWIDLLGYRSYYEGGLNYEYYRTGITYTYEWHSYLFESSITGERLQPEGIFETWEPEFLVFGKTNLKSNVLDIRNQDGLYLGIGLGKEFSGLHFEYRFQQYLPLHSEKRGVRNIPSDIGEPSGDINRSLYGGGRHSLRLRYEL